MKNDTISRKALLKELRKELRECRKDGEEFGGESILWAEGIEFAIDAVKEAPTIEARPVVRGEWLHDSATGIAFCSVCNMDAVEDGTNFCPECGADMRPKEEANED